MNREKGTANFNSFTARSGGEQRFVLIDDEDSAANRRRDETIVELFEAQAAQTPGQTALVFEQHRLTYSELNHRADQLSNHLRTLGAGPDVLIGLFVERSLDTIVGLLGILKA